MRDPQADSPDGTVQRSSRRQWLHELTGSMTAAMMGPSLFGLLSSPAMAGSRFHAKTKKLILIWLEGGPSQLDTFDPKPGAPTGGPFKALDTDVQGWRFSETLPQLARRAEDLCVLRGMTSREGNHSRARLFVKTGYAPNPTVDFPSIGAIVGRELGEPEFDLPAFVQINGAPSPSGYLGVEHGPLVLRSPTAPISNLEYARGVGTRRMDHRESMLKVLEDSFGRNGGEDPVRANRSLRKRARRLMDTKRLSAFDLDREKNSLRSRYGDNNFGQGCLLARRLIENGVSAVEVVLGGWDTHDDNFNRVRNLSSQLDPALATLIDDLKKRDLDQETLVVCMGEFGRTPRIASSDGRNHWPASWCAALFGAGIKGGLAHGTTDETGENIVSDTVTVPDLFSTFSHVLGFDPDVGCVVAKRPITLVDPEGKIVRGILG